METGKSFFMGSEELKQYDGLSSILINPLRISGRIWGLFCAVCIGNVHRFTDLDFTQLTIFAGYSSLLIDNYLKYVELIGKKEAQYRALQSQIQPHFLFNVLNGFIGLNRMGKKDSLEKTILALRGMLRYTLDHNEWTTVKEEFNFLKEYCELQQMRFDPRFQFKITMDEEVSAFLIPKLIVQPLVENAVIHGIEPLDRVGTLCITGSVEFVNNAEYLKILVQDDGIGFDLDVLNKKKRVGISNIEERLSIAFSSASLSIQSKKDEYTHAVILINLKESLNENSYS